ncbi:uncharacterized protein LOC128553538 isoform X3 [Mercenaria mercenaria]|uniref:uncharacterized protein LOC128553538 isoform X3 n=1 Tax=Mercenaria mercenaria TaxID=6596 RepID=UPI00234F2863|nr:uncharacterized protein LOC128553538 isoform X3 [Mercenaria mercenaria]
MERKFESVAKRNKELLVQNIKVEKDRDEQIRSCMVLVEKDIENQQKMLDLKNSEESLKLLLKTRETELQGKEEVIQKKNSDMVALNKHICDSKIYIEKLQGRKDDITVRKAKDDLLHKETVESLQSRIEQLGAQKRKDDLLHKKTVECLQSRIQEMSAEKTKENIEHTDTVKKLQALVDEERKTRFELSYQYSQLIQAKQAPENVKKLGNPEHKIQSLLLLRQDKEQQTELSHYIADLSDEKRPTKLAEDFSELYDNEWTDAFGEVGIENDKQKVDFLLRLLNRANEICRNASTEYTSAIKRGFCTLVVETDPTTGEVYGEVPGRLASVGTEIILEEQNINQHSEAVAAYIRKCMNICWSMCRHMPPMHVDVPDVTGCIHFDTNKYKPYTKSGSYVHYIVWPALYLHEGGPVLCKGVAQGRK